MEEGSAMTTYPLLDQDKFPSSKQISNDSGIYWIVAANKLGQPIPLQRVCGCDPDGILYVGRSSRLRSRLQTLSAMLRTVDPRAAGHIAGLHYKANRSLRNRFPAKVLKFGFKHCANEKMAEDSKLRRYLKRFGEFPPLNGAGMSWPE
jgi:hypothetical protein